MPASTSTSQHHHRNTTKSGHKPFKPRFASKNELKDRAKGRVEQFQPSFRKTRHQQVMSKFDRKNQAKQKRLTNHRENAQITSVFAGKHGAPRVVALVPLCESIDTHAAIRSLNVSLDLEAPSTPDLLHLTNIDRFRQKLQYIALPRDILSIMDACRVADYVLFVFSADENVDSSGEEIIRCVEGQGISQAYAVVQGLHEIATVKQSRSVRAYCESFIRNFFPEMENVFSLDTRQEMQNMIRSLCTTVPKGIRWREDRSWMLVEDVQWPSDSDIAIDDDANNSNLACVTVTGIVRGRNLKADRLVHIGDWGDFQIEKIIAAPDENARKGKDIKTAQAMDTSGQELDIPSEDRDNMDELAPEETIMNDVGAPATSIALSERKSVLLDDLHNISDSDEEQGIEVPKKLPRGTSKYQSAWFVGDLSDDGSDMEDVDLDLNMTDDVVMPADGIEGASKPFPADPSEAAMSEMPDSEVFDDLSPDDKAEAAELATFRAQKKTLAEEDRQFPDEVELQPQVAARERLARYRGLKSLRNSPWDVEEDLPYQPADYDRLLEIKDYKRAKNRVLSEALVGGVKAGTRVQIFLRNVPHSLQQSYSPSKPLPLFSLLRHEHKRAAVDVSISLATGHPEPLKSKEELIMQCGPRRFVIQPLFSDGGNTPNNVHKFLRYLHPGQTAVASFTAPLTWGYVPILFFKREAKQAATLHDPNSNTEMDVDLSGQSPNVSNLRLIGKGTMLPSSLGSTQSSSKDGLSSSPRVIAKRITLTGQPYKIHKKLVTIRYMFFNPDDVHYFRSLPLWTNRGRQGVIKDSLGTHGYFKATFDSKLGMMDAIGVSLYKRVWPRPARNFTEQDKS